MKSNLPLIELRDTLSGRVAYLKGTRLTVHWINQRVRDGMSAALVAHELEISKAQLDAVMAYSEAFSEEIELDIEAAESNRRWVELQDSAWRAGHQQGQGGNSRLRPRK